MATNKADNPHTAITIWSGFVYQGKVAIYHVLQLLKQQGMTTPTCSSMFSMKTLNLLPG
jgi:hypothetical protein